MSLVAAAGENENKKCPAQCATTEAGGVDKLWMCFFYPSILSKEEGKRKMKKAVIYARFSSEMQRSESIDAQVRACKYYAQQYGYDIIQVFSDSARSGMSTKGRDQLAKMMANSASSDWSAVLVHKLDRFGRNARETLANKDILESHGIELISVTERLEDTPEGRLMLMIILGMNEFYSRNLAREVMKGMRENAYNAKHTGGTPPLGYDIGPDLKYTINQAEAETVQTIFNLYASGIGYSQIISRLNLLGYRTKKGTAFGKNSIHDILRNEKYRGVFVFNRTPTRKNGHRNNHTSKVSDDIIRIDGGCPAIVSNELFERVQGKMEQNKHHGAANKAKVTYLLSGKLYCGLCGHKMVGTPHSVRGETYHYYACNASQRKGTCTKKQIRKETIEALVLEELNAIAFNPDFIHRFAAQMFSTYEGGQVEKQRERIQKEITTLEGEIANLVKAIAAGTDVPALHDAVKERQEQITQLKAAAAVGPDIPKGLLNLEQLEIYLGKFFDISRLSTIGQKAVIQAYVSKVICYDDEPDPNGKGGFRIEIVLNPNNIEITKDDWDNFVHMSCTAPPAPAYTQHFFLLNGVVIIKKQLFV